MKMDWDDVMDLNIKSVFFMSQAVAKQFIVQGSGGKIINIASMLSYQGDPRTFLHRVQKCRDRCYPTAGE